MALSDDDELKISRPSPHEEFTKTYKGRKDALIRAIEDSTKKNVSIDKTELKAEISLSRLKEDLSGEQDEEEKRQKKVQKKVESSKTFGTKTRKQEAEAAISSAKDEATPDQMIKTNAARKEKKAQAGEEYQQQMG